MQRSLFFDPDYNPRSIRAKRRYDRAKLFGGRKLTRLIRDSLRRAEGPLSTQEVVSAIAVELDGGAGAPLVAKRVGMGLQYLARRGSIVKEGARKTARWAVAG